MQKGKTSLNIITNTLAFIINIMITFWLTPYVTENIGNEAYGFISLSNAVIVYINIASTALNAYASRFICLSYLKKEYKDANKYYSSVLCANAIMVILLLVLLEPFIKNLQIFFSVSEELLPDIQKLFIYTFFSYFVSLIGVSFSIGTIINNRLDIEAVRNIISYFIKSAIIIFGFVFLGRHVWIVSIATLASSIFVFAVNFIYQKYSTIQLKFCLRYVSWKYICDVMKSGVWSSIGSIGNILNSGLDIWVTNKFLDGISMGYIAIANNFLNILQGLVSMLSTIYWPKILEAYSKEKKSEVLDLFKRSMKLEGAICSIIAGGFLVVGKEFLALWLPSQDGEILYHIVSISIVSAMLCALTRPIGAVFTLVNRLKLNAFCNILVGFCNFILMLLLISFTEMGVYAVVLTSAIPNMVYSILFVPIRSAYYLNCSLVYWGKEILRYFILLAVITFLMRAGSFWLTANTWIKLGIKIIICGGIGGIINYFFYLSSFERDMVLNMIKGKNNENRNDI